MADSSSTQRFSSRWGLLLSVLGIAVGTGNIWRFPRIAAANAGEGGAGAFLVAWLVFLLAWSIPLIIAEYALGQRGRRGVVGSFAKLAGGKVAWLGGFVAFVAAAIMCYYSVVAGWTAFYVAKSTFAGLPVTTEASLAGWNAFQGSLWPIVLHGLMMTLGVLAVSGGVRGIERANKFLVPTLLVIVVIAVVRAVTLPGAGAGIAYLFTPDWSTLASPAVWLEALTQNAWDTGAGWGLILTYAAYMRREDGVVRNAVLTGVGNNTVSLLAATMVFGIVFAVLGDQMPQGEILDLMKNSGERGTGMTFIWMPQLFAEMPLGSASGGALLRRARLRGALQPALHDRALDARVRGLRDRPQEGRARRRRGGLPPRRAERALGLVLRQPGLRVGRGADALGRVHRARGGALRRGPAARGGRDAERLEAAARLGHLDPVRHPAPGRRPARLVALARHDGRLHEPLVGPAGALQRDVVPRPVGRVLVGLYLANGWMVRRLARTGPEAATVTPEASGDFPRTP